MVGQIWKPIDSNRVMTIETPEQARRAQQQIEDVARLAAAVQRAVRKLEDEFCGLSDFPEHLAEAMPRLSAAANDCASITREWADIGA
jgi:plasmid stabilization system protein ParE